MFKVRFYFGDKDYVGKVVNVRMISFTDKNDGLVSTESDELWSNPKNFIILEPVRVTYDVYAKRVEIIGA